MISIIIFYIILLVGSGLFYILYRGDISFYLFLFVIILPVFSMLSMILSKKKLRISVNSTADGRKNNKFPVIISISNRSVFPFSVVRITLEYYNSQINSVKTFDINTSASGHSDFQLKLSLSSEYCGIICVKIKKVRVYDLLGIFSCKIPNKLLLSSKYQCQVGIVPEIIDLDAEISSVKSVDYESDFYSKTQSGDDPSEIYDMHDYNPGDKLNKIHWKLTAKLDSIYVKDYSLPVSSSVYIFYYNSLTDHASKEEIKRNDAVLDVIFSLSYFLCENDLSHKIIFKSNDDTGYKAVKIEDVEDLYATFFEMIFTTKADENFSFTESFVYENSISPMSRILYFKADGDPSSFSVDEYFSNCYVTLFCCKNEGNEIIDISHDNYFDIIKIDPDNIQKSVGYIDI